MSSSTVDPYQPTSRRPIADRFRQTAHAVVRVCVRCNIHPDVISYGSMVAAALAAFCFWKSPSYPWLLLVGPLFCYARLWLNMLDGMVALASGKASLRGEILNDLPDRVSDVMIFTGLAHSGWCNPFLAYWASMGAVFTAYVGTFGQAVAGKREFGGIMSKPWRMVTLHVGAWLTFGLLHVPCPLLSPHRVMNGLCWVVIFGCVQTIWVRLASTLNRLAARKQAPSTSPLSH